jgi:hypothetical protein
VDEEDEAGLDEHGVRGDPGSKEDSFTQSRRRDTSPSSISSQCSRSSFGEKSVCEPIGKYKFLTFRMVREGHVQLRDIRVMMQAQYAAPRSAG